MVQDKGLKERAKNLPALLEHRWADSTAKKYRRGWNEWINWCERYPESRGCPAEGFYLALFFNDLVLQDRKVGTLDTAAAGVRWGHILAGFDNPLDDILVKTALEGAKRTIGKSTGKNQKEPFMLSHNYLLMMQINLLGGF